MGDVFDLYEFPKGYVGRRTYVHVTGHARSIPKPYTYVGLGGHNAILPECGGEPMTSAVSTAYVMSDISPYRSPLDNSMVSSRSEHRDHMRRHDVIEVGTQPMGSMRRDENAPMPRVGHDIARAMRGETGRN